MECVTTVKEAWDRVTPKSIQNNFVKADLGVSISSGAVSSGSDDIDLNTLVSGFARLEIPLTEENMNQCAKVDNNGSDKITQSTLEEVASARVPKALGSDDENLQEEEAASSNTG